MRKRASCSTGKQRRTNSGVETNFPPSDSICPPGSARKGETQSAEPKTSESDALENLIGEEEEYKSRRPTQGGRCFSGGWNEGG